MQNAVLMRVVNGASDLRDEFHRLSERHRLSLDYLVKLAALDKSHAEVARAVPLAHLIDGYNPWMFETRGSFSLPAKTLQVRFGGPRAHANHLECHCAIETLLPGAKYHALTTPTDHLQQFVIAQLSQCVRSAGCFFLLVSS